MININLKIFKNFFNNFKFKWLHLQTPPIAKIERLIADEFCN